MQFKSIVALFLLTACASGPALNNADGLQAERLEIAMDASGRAREIEYHISRMRYPLPCTRR